MTDAEPPRSNGQQKEVVGQPFAAVGMGVRNLIRQCVALFGLFLIGIAIPIAFLTPILPIGLPLAIIGVILLGRNAVWGRRWMEGMIARYPSLERFAPNWLMKLVFGRPKKIFRKS